MPRLDQFPGFKVEPSRKTFFNPFSMEERTNNYSAEESMIRISPYLAPMSVNNMLDAPQDSKDKQSSSDTNPIFPTTILKTDSQEPEAEAEPVPMVQPRDKNGQRLLYKHPNLPCVGVKGSHLDSKGGHLDSKGGHLDPKGGHLASKGGHLASKGAYWLLVGQSDRSSTAHLMQFDGAANPNPGPASSGAVLWGPKDLDGKRQPIFEMGKYLGKATNNIAEVQGLLLGLKIAAMRGVRELLIEGDSELIIFQQTRKYQVKDKNLKVWWSEIQAAMMDETTFDWIAIRQVPRELNERADSITKEVLSRKSGFSR